MQQIDTTAVEKVPPHDRQAETSLLGALLLDNAYIPTVCSIINNTDFYDKRHGLIFDAIRELFEQNVPADLVTVTDKLITSKSLEEVGGRAYLVELTEDIYSSANSERYATIVREKSILRRLMQVTSSIYNQAQRMEGEVRDLLDVAEARIFELSTMKPEKGVESIKTLLPTTFRKLEEMPQLQGQVTGLATGFTRLDEMTSGLHDGELVIVAGRPGMGKTAFGLRVVENVAVEQGKACAVFSLEMSSEQLVQRLLCSRAKVSSHRLRTGRLRDAEWTNLNYAVGPLSESPIFLDDSASLSIWDLRTKARMLKSQYDIQLVMVDYLQLMTAHERTENRQQEISLISRSLKGLAKELGIPVIACSQLSRLVETRGGEKRPILADLRESGAIEQDADMVMFVYRPAAYKLSMEEREAIRGTEEENLAEIIVAKQRNGPTGTIKLTFLEDCIRFENREAFREGPPGDVPF
jgi:replicative DNA helicase